MKKTILLLLVVLFSVYSSRLQAIYRYVSLNGEGNGLSWSTARGSIQSVIQDASQGDTILVSMGVYEQGFSLKDGVSVLGGYNSQLCILRPTLPQHHLPRC